MNRREAVKATTLFIGGTLVASSGVLTSCAPAARTTSGVLNGDDQDLIEEIADTLLPTTKASPGAKAAGAGAAINLILTDCYDAGEQQRVARGLKSFRATCRERTRTDFASLPRKDREQLLRAVDAESRTTESHYFRLVRELAEGAYFSSEIGKTKALRYVQTPGRWEGCVPLTPGQPAWG